MPTSDHIRKRLYIWARNDENYRDIFIFRNKQANSLLWLQ